MTTPASPIATPAVAIKKGDWLFDGNQRIARVKSVYFDPAAKETLLDLYPYSTSGESIGRWCGPMGGPTTFEPCCSAEGWRRIERPKFPLMDRYGIKDKVTYLDSQA